MLAKWDCSEYSDLSLVVGALLSETSMLTLTATWVFSGTYFCVYLGLMLLLMEKGESDGVCWISRLCMCSRELLVKNVPHPSSVFERTINPHSSNPYIVLCTHYSACSCLFGLIPVKDGTRMSTLVTFFMSLSDPGVFGPNFYFLCLASQCLAAVRITALSL